MDAGPKGATGVVIGEKTAAGTWELNLTSNRSDTGLVTDCAIKGPPNAVHRAAESIHRVKFLFMLIGFM